MLVELFLRNGPIRPGDQVDHANARIDFADELPFPRPPREDVDGDAHFGQSSCDRPHVDVHPSGIPHARLVQRTRVNGEERDPGNRRDRRWGRAR